MRKLSLLLLGFLLFAGNLFAQRTVTGKVTDEKGSPIPNVSVIVQGTTTGTTTKADGSYSLVVPATAKGLLFTSVDMIPYEISLSGQSVINAAMKVDDKSLTEVVVTGYSREKKSQFTGAATVLSASKTVETVPVGAFDQALQGRAPGVLVNSSSGQPGTSANIVIRGVQSIQGAGAQPLYVIDGIPLPAADMQTINPNDFETITILKDAGAAAMYGARAGVGVIVITTKKGRANTSNFLYRTQVGFTQPPNPNKFDMMNTTEILQYEERLKLAGTPGWNYSKNNPAYAGLPATSPANAPYSDSKARFDFMLDSIGQINTNYADLLFRQGLSQLHEFNASGGSDKTRFFLSGSFFDQKGTDLTSRLKRYTTRLNIDHTMGKLSIQYNLMAGYSITHYSEGEWLGNSAANSFQMSWRAKPYENPYRQDGSLIFGANSTLALKQIGNVIEGIENSILRQNQVKINSGLTLAYRLFPGLTFKNTLGIDVADDRWQRFIKPLSFVGSRQINGGSGINSEAYKLNAQLINTTSLIFNKRINNRHDIEVGGYFEVLRGYQKGLGFTLYNLDPRLDQTGQGAGNVALTPGNTTYPQNATSAKSGYGIRSFFANARYTFDNKYTVTGNIRRDGTSRILNEENKEITTYSFGAIWNAIGEDFLKSQRFLTDLKVRMSYGAVPNIASIPTGSYGAGGGLVSVTNYLGPQQPSFGTTTAFAGSTITGLVPTTPGNPNLKIETIKKLNLGVDFAMWKDRARVTFDVYQNKTVDLFVRNPLPANSGFASLDINAGIMTNKGWELSLSVDVIKQRNMDLTLGVVHSVNKNNIEDLGLVTEYFLGTFVIREGLPYGSHYTYNYLGADPTTGRPRFEKLDGTETLDIAQAGQFAKFGTYLPKHVGGFTADFRYGRITLSALFSYQFDVVRSNNTENWVVRGTPGYHTSVNASRRLLTEQWMKPGDVKFYQGSAYDRGFTSSDLQDAKFLRFRNLNVAYNIPELSIKGTRIVKSARVYVMMQNVAIWSPWRGPDPEDGNNISLNEFPNPRMVVAGIDINF